MATEEGAEVIGLSAEFGIPAIQKKLDLLSDIHGSLENFHIRDRGRFTEMMYSVFVVAQIGDRDLADDKGYAITSVRRWITGKNAPHKSSWDRIREWCLKALSKEMDALQRQLDQHQIVAATM